MDYLSLVPQRLDVFSFVIFLGVIQGLFFSYTLLRTNSRQNPKNKYLGIFLLLSATVLIEVFLCYSGLIVHVLWLVDFSEPTNFLNGPIFLFLIYAFLNRPILNKSLLHFVPFLIYLLYMGFFFVQPEAFKFNAYVDAYYPEIVRLDVNQVIDADPLKIKAYINQIAVVYTFIYAIIGIVVFLKDRRNSFVVAQKREIKWLQFLIILLMISFSFWLLKSFTGWRDSQDHIGAAINTLIIYFVGFKILTEKFKPQADMKYSKSSLDIAGKDRIARRLKLEVLEEKYYMRNDISLTDLADRLGTSNHHLSQFLNEQVDKTFLEFINEHRVTEAKIQLVKYPHLKIEEIGAQVGFNSKSTFNSAFKKLLGRTPSEFRESQGVD